MGRGGISSVSPMPTGAETTAEEVCYFFAQLRLQCRVFFFSPLRTCVWYVAYSVAALEAAAAAVFAAALSFFVHVNGKNRGQVSSANVQTKRANHDTIRES